MLKLIDTIQPFWTVYEGDGDGNPPPKTFTQEELNAILAEEKRKSKKQYDTTVAQLEELKKAKGLSDQERSTLQSQIDELKNQHMSAEEIAKRDREKLEGDYKKQIDGLNSNLQSWQSRYADLRVKQEITSSVTDNGGLRTEQFIELLAPKTRLVPEIKDGKETGELVPMVKFNDVDADKKPVTLDLTIPQVVKRMKELPERFGNLFKAENVSGVGGNNIGPTAPPADVKNMTHDQYKEWRKKNLK